jgi:hypothetical protein
MRLEDLIVRYLPDGGTVSDRRPDVARGQLSFSASASVTVTADAGTPDLVLIEPDQLARTPADARWTAVLAVTPPGAAPVADVLAWAGTHSGQLVEATGLLAPRCVALVVEHTSRALLPTQPGVPADPADPAAWRRLAGELVAERLRCTVLAEELDRARDAAQAEKLRADEARSKLREVRKRQRAAAEPRAHSGLAARLARLGRRHR